MTHEALFKHTDTDGDEVVVLVANDPSQVIVAVHSEGSGYRAAFAPAETLADALNGHVERDEPFYVIDGIGMTEAQYVAATGSAGTETLRMRAAKAYGNSAAHGFWADAPAAVDPAFLTYLGNKLMLIVGEVAEAHEELRKGVELTETYYLDASGQRALPAYLQDADERGVLLKPEGLPSELADIVIRVLDLAGALNIDLDAAIEEKAAFNATRPPKHGKRF